MVVGPCGGRRGPVPGFDHFRLERRKGWHGREVVLLLAAVYGFLSVGPTSPAAEWRRAAESALAATSTTQPPVIEEDLANLPDPLAAYVRTSFRRRRPAPDGEFS